MRVIILSEVSWNYLKQRHHYFAEGLANSYDVHFVERMGIRTPRALEILYHLQSLIFKSSTHSNRSKGFQGGRPKSIRLVPKFFLPGHSKVISFLNRNFLIPIFCKYFLKIEKQRVLLISYLPTNQTLEIIRQAKINAKKCLVVYDCVHNFPKHPFAPPNISALEASLVGAADLCVGDSKQNFDRLRKLSNRVALVPPGVELDLFYNKVPSPSVGSGAVYFGHFRAENDVEALNIIAKKMPVTIIGSVNREVADLLSSEIRVSPPMPPDELAPILKTFEAVLLLYKHDDFASNILPAKFYECIALGIPIICNEHPSFIQFEDFVNIFDRKGFKSLDLSRLKVADSGERFIFLRENTWSARVELLLLALGVKK